MKELIRKPVLYIFSVLLCLLFTEAVEAQENLLFNKVQTEKSKRKNFTDVSKAFSPVAKQSKGMKSFLKADDVDIFQYDKKTLGNLTDAISFTLPLKKGNMVMDLIEVPSSFYNYSVVTSDGKRQPANTKIKHYRGVVKDDPNSIVAISFADDEVIGLVSTKEGNFNLSLNRELNQYAYYKDNNVTEKLNFKCSTPDSPQEYDAKVLSQQSKQNIGSGTKCVRFYLETEYDIYQYMGSVTGVEMLIAGTMNQVSALYENENIETGISEIRVWTTPDPYTATTTSTLLAQFKNQTSSMNGDLGQLLTFRNIGGGEAAGNVGICNSNVDERLAVSGIDPYYLSVPNYSWSVSVITHEFGHLFGSRHTHACVWNGNNTAIDGCAGGTEGGCSLPGLPAGGGTIMSYCHQQAGIGINFSLGFGPQPGNVIRNSVLYGGCLVQCFSGAINGSTTICTSENYSIVNLPAGATVTWSVSNPGLVSLSASGTSVTLTRLSGLSGGVTLTATVGNLPYAQIHNINKRIQVGVPTLDNGNIYFRNHGGPPVNPTRFERCEYEGDGYFIYTYNDNNTSDVFMSNFEFEVLPGSNYEFVPGRAGDFDYYINHSFSGTLSIPVRIKNACGWSDAIFYLDIIVPDCPFSHKFVAYPNPASSDLTVTCQENQENAEQVKRFKKEKVDFSIKLFNEKGELLKSAGNPDQGDSITIKTGDVLPGTYYLHIFQGKSVIKKQIIIRH